MIQISEYDFDTSSHFHGWEHTERVMKLVQHLGKIGNLPKPLVLEAYCAAVIHDMARTHDGYCEMHGQWAVDTKLSVWTERFFEVGLLPKQVEAVAFAVHWHCKNFKTVPDSPHLTTLMLLHDADALDRVRFNGPASIRLDYLHFEFTQEQIPFAEKLLWEY